MKKVVAILFLLLHFGSIAQVDALPDDTKVRPKGWQNGYIVMREKGDTIYGKVRRHNDWIDFKKNETDKKKPYWSDSIKAYKYSDDCYCHFKYTGWTKLIVGGEINLFEGMSTTALSAGTRCFVLKKGKEPALFIERNNPFEGNNSITKGFGTISKDNLQELRNYFFNDKGDYYERVKKEDFKFNDIIKLVTDYNNALK